MPNKDNNNWIWLLIAGILGIGGVALFGNASNKPTDNTQPAPPKKFGCGCNKGL